MPTDWRQTPLLVVGERREQALFLRKLLAGLGFLFVEREENADAALERLRSQRYGAVVADAPPASWAGVELAKEIRADERLRALPFVLVSAAADRDSVLAAKEAGITGYVLKPFSTATLQRAVARGLGDAGRAPVRRAS